MPHLSDFKDHWALVTGASSGIGREFCVQLAQAGMHLVLVARREPELVALAQELTLRYAIKTLVLPMDLAQPQAASAVESRLRREGLKIRLLCNNAGVGHWGRFEQGQAQSYETMMALNMGAVALMCYALLPQLSSFPTSAVINVSSPAAYQPIPYMAVYAASKAFVHSLSQALHGEWSERGVLVQTLVPGPTETEFDAKAGAYASAIQKRGGAKDVVRASLAGLARALPVVTVAKGTYKQRFFAGLFPSGMVIREVGKMFRPRELG